jgi:hypothetical protein
MVGHFIFYTCSVYGTFGVLGYNPTDISRWELVRVLPLAALIRRSAGWGSGSRSAASSAVASSCTSSMSSLNASRI